MNNKNNTDKTIERDLKLLCEKMPVPEINLQKAEAIPFKQKKVKKRILLVAATLMVFLVVGITANASSIYSFFSQIFTFGYVDPGVEQLSSSDIYTYTDVNVNANDIKLEATHAVSDTYRTIIQLKATGLHLSGTGILEILPQDISLYDESGKQYELDSISSGAYEKGKTYDTDVCPAVFEGGPTKKSKMKLYVSKINGITGKWALEFEITPNTDVEEFTSDTNYKFNNGTEITLTDCSAYLTRTVVEGRYDEFIEGNRVDVGEYSYISRPSTINTAILYVNGKEVEQIAYGSDLETFYITFAPINTIVSDSKIELELQLDYVLDDDGVNSHPDPNNILRKEIKLIPVETKS